MSAFTLDDSSFLIIADKAGALYPIKIALSQGGIIDKLLDGSTTPSGG